MSTLLPGWRAWSARWAITLVATLVSTWALDAVATVAGVTLAASEVLQPAPHAVVVALLVLSYVTWGAGLRVNLRANWRLLEDTGTSTNALSKMLFDLLRRRSSSRRSLYAASALGYVIPEIAKEAPYYAGAFGAAVLTDSVDATHALIFLAGANLGAALYEYAVGRLTRGYLDGRSRRVARAS
ncbi:MAG TPA: hypothetical protein DEQ43_23825 [Nocardioides bacterium]|uniref:hypothetical protein n=1 Tax=uncultured Nocardioides sp. TaxID=198441 RepID=UPI000EDDC6CE|nr:hypothetical protein [uncultured Nocardioides sp.]HCB07240.1 hypothetical protein [Nocardioides sp.]HRD60242.1 hypothetical protein [Nocardioides sp.]HRK44963.1 hypothetical protein [Nocardioides sp.]